MSSDIKTIAQTYLTSSTKCSHCGKKAELEYIDDGLIGAHVCPSRYVSRIIAYGKQLDSDEFKKYMQEALQNMERVENSDIRIARRYAWDLGLDRKSNDPILMELYWTQSYRRTKNDSSDRLSLFLCSNKDSFFVQPLNANERVCPNCRR